MSDDKGKKSVKPIWMPLYVTEFIADTANLTASQGWAYINLLCAMWRTEDGTLPHDADTLARVGKVHRPRWAKVWDAIKSLFDVDGDRVTSAPLQAELGKANALIVARRAAAKMGGRTTQFRRSMNAVHRVPMTAPKPLKNNDGVLCVRTRAAIAAALVNRPSREAAFGGELTCLSGAQGKVSLQLAGHSHPSGELAG